MLTKDDLRKDYLTTGDAARLKGTTRQTIYNYIRWGFLDAILVGKVYYIKQTALDDFVPRRGPGSLSEVHWAKIKQA